MQWHYSGYQEDATLNGFFCYIRKRNLGGRQSNVSITIPRSTGGSWIRHGNIWLTSTKILLSKMKKCRRGACVSDKRQISQTENQTNCCITVKWLSWEYFARIQKRKKTSLIDIWIKSIASILCSREKDNMQIGGLLLLDYRTQCLYYKKLTF